MGREKGGSSAGSETRKMDWGQIVKALYTNRKCVYFKIIHAD